MRHRGVSALFMLAFLSAHSHLYADTAKEILLDRQVDLNLPQKSDPLSKKKKPAVKISYNGIWLVKRVSDECKSRIGDFKIRISGDDISTVVGMNVRGRMLADGLFEMNAKSQYWIIRFSGKLKEKSGLGKWMKVDTQNNTCAGSINLTRIDR